MDMKDRSEVLDSTVEYTHRYIKGFVGAHLGTKRG